MTPKKKKTKRDLQAEETKNKIIQATMSIMEKKGFQNITIQEINNRAGVSVGTFYHYFTNKDDVFFELYKEADDFFKEEVEIDLYAEDLHSLERIVRFFSWYARFNNKNGLEYVRQLYNTNNKFFISEDRYMIRLLDRIVSDGMEKGEVTTELSPMGVVRHLFMLARGIVFDWCLHEGEDNLEQLMTNYFRRIITSFQNP
jgi:AcrR family transcriptional regulator